MPAVKRLPMRLRVDVSAEQDAWVRRQADQRSMSVAAVIRDLIQAAMSAERGNDSRTQEPAA